MIGNAFRLIGATLVVSICLLGTQGRTSWATEQSDIERAERIQAIHDLARTIFERSHERATNAVNQTAAGKENNQRVKDLNLACLEADTTRLDMHNKARMRGEAVGRLDLDSNWAITKECMQDAENSNPNAEIIAYLRAEFIEEELETLRDSMERAVIEELRDAVQEWSL